LPEAPEKDPILSQSLAGYLLISALLLVISLGWALYDEVFGLRPWKSYQRRFVSLYSEYLQKQIPKQRAAEEAIRAAAEFQALEQELKDLENAVAPKLAEIERQATLLDQRLSVISDEYTTLRADVGARIYRIEHTSSPKGKKSLEDDLNKFKRGPFVVKLPVAESGGRLEKTKFTFEQLEDEFNRLQAEKGKVLAQQAEILRPRSELQQKRDAYLQDHLNGLTAEQLEGIQNKMDAFTIEIKQINNPDAGVVDRCESCHVGTREPVVLTRRDMGGEAAFTSHPQMELLKIHDPEKFGCTPCHNGNGMQVQSIREAHGKYKHWLWPQYEKANFEAGCQQCHTNDMVLDQAPVLTAGKELFQYRGCMGCHRYQGYDPEPEELLSVRQSIQQLEAQRVATQKEVQRTIQQGDEAPDNETARALYTRADTLRVSISDLDARIEQLDFRSGNLLRDIKKVGPNLKEVRAKLRPEWIPVWIENPTAFRPTTRMPQFRLTREERNAISAFLWQAAIDARADRQPPGDPVKGRESFQTRGCMGCHAVGEGANATGGTFAANLTRVGEKVKYDYLVQWIHDPRERIRPYCPYEKRDLGPRDYAKKGLPYVFDLDHSKCPNDGHELQVQQMTVMPNLRLSWQEVRDIASYLMTLKTTASYPAAPFLNDPKLKEEGKALVKRHGCAGCHEISGMEEEGRIGTELTLEGSKPLEQFDFGLYLQKAHQQDWYSHKGFFERKLAKPNVFDDGRIRAPSEQLRMPNPHLKPEEIAALTTFLLGSVNSQLPQRYFDLPEDWRKDIQDGWWLIKKYNCMGCHQFQVTQSSALMTVPWYQTAEGKDQLPPKLLGVGARVNPDWLAKFLANPAMAEKDIDRNGVRPYLNVRMPTFSFSPNEIRKLVRFFEAAASQPLPYLPPRLEPLSSQEVAMARALFTSRAAPCLKCHATGEPSHDRFVTAPNFLLARERLKPGWTKRWLLDPSMISPGTGMPSGLFKREGDRWVFSGPTPPIFKGYGKDHADLLVRYMFEITPEEQRRLLGMRTTAADFPLPRRGKSGSSLAGALPGVPSKAH